MLAINIKLWRHHESQDWSIEVDGKHHAHVSIQAIEEIVEYVLLSAQQTLLES